MQRKYGKPAFATFHQLVTMPDFKSEASLTIKTCHPLIPTRLQKIQTITGLFEVFPLEESMSRPWAIHGQKVNNNFRNHKAPTPLETLCARPITYGSLPHYPALPLSSLGPPVKLT